MKINFSTISKVSFSVIASILLFCAATALAATSGGYGSTGIPDYEGIFTLSFDQPYLLIEDDLPNDVPGRGNTVGTVVLINSDEMPIDNDAIICSISSNADRLPTLSRYSDGPNVGTTDQVISIWVEGGFVLYR